MAALPDIMMMRPDLVVGGVLLLVLGSNPVWGNSTTTINGGASNNTTGGHNIAAIVAPTVTLGVLAIVSAVLAWLFCVVKKKRQTEGTYRPSAEEQSGTKGPGLNSEQAYILWEQVPSLEPDNDGIYPKE